MAPKQKQKPIAPTSGFCWRGRAVVAGTVYATVTIGLIFLTVAATAWEGYRE